MTTERSPRDPLLRLALRVIEHFHLVGQESDLLLPEAVPPDLPFQVPVPPGGVLVGSQLAPDNSYMNIYVDTDLKTDDAFDFYRRSLEALGWRPVPYEESEPFATLEDRFGDDSTEEWPEEEDDGFTSPDERFEANISSHDTDEGVTSVALYVAKRGEEAIDPEEAAQARMVALLPRLDPPGRAEEWEIGFSGSADSAERRADVISDLDMAAFAAHYDRAIAEAGWVRSDEELTMRSAWSAWERQDEPDGPLYLLWLAVRLPAVEAMYTILVRVGSQGHGLPPESWGTR